MNFHCFFDFLLKEELILVKTLLFFMQRKENYKSINNKTDNIHS